MTGLRGEAMGKSVSCFCPRKIPSAPPVSLPAPSVAHILLLRTFESLTACLTLKSSMISSDPPGMAYALTSLPSLSTFSPRPPLT